MFTSTPLTDEQIQALWNIKDSKWDSCLDELISDGALQPFNEKENSFVIQTLPSEGRPAEYRIVAQEDYYIVKIITPVDGGFDIADWHLTGIPFWVFKALLTDIRLPALMCSTDMFFYEDEAWTPGNLSLRDLVQWMRGYEKQLTVVSDKLYGINGSEAKHVRVTVDYADKSRSVSYDYSVNWLKYIFEETNNDGEITARHVVDSSAEELSVGLWLAGYDYAKGHDPSVR